MSNTAQLKNSRLEDAVTCEVADPAIVAWHSVSRSKIKKCHRFLACRLGVHILYST